jgi:hypothetical protein
MSWTRTQRLARARSSPCRAARIPMSLAVVIA